VLCPKIDGLFKLQKRAARIILNMKVAQSPTADIFRVLSKCIIYIEACAYFQSFKKSGT
jgi:hypothetical protein